ncbi:MAG: hypothetical protein COU22_01185 [Candidatus Komeilibacteria bacterium CG10_big_fil_rev_8_21_14_0_10_41_13]|uniref:Type II secretion system protein GspG C-terminal domain-containing protein n=1 Tax=Candidatus Komeilibacteria bacterium CG10_big_fil_rev_8_21_14_0_10_41_13 TaxID=1974476 RepID=A0A2M6WCT4_9BACT|nr:MAG: hypothetical protein COU22_01185 [Candidatus Komeilibacteria bacterium CG10_big_fil_rev_8_21_14_0_10_41_13]
MADELSPKSLIIRILFLILIVFFLVLSVLYVNKRWEKIRDIRRQADAKSIVKALDFYNIQFGEFPENVDDDGDGWDKTNDQEKRTFLNPLVDIGLLPSLVFDPKNDEDYYYRYQKFAAGEFGCKRSFAVFQVSKFESEPKNVGQGECPDLNWIQLAPQGYTWFSYE